MKRNVMLLMIIFVSLSLLGSSIGWGNLQWPFSISIVQGETTENIYGQVWMDGVAAGPRAVSHFSPKIWKEESFLLWKNFSC